MSGEQHIGMEGAVATVLPGTLGGVKMELLPDDLTKERITYRLR